MSTLALMQGRLLPPVAGRIQAFPGTQWPHELALLRDVGLDAIELVADDHARDANPLLVSELRPALLERLARLGVSAPSVCGDALMTPALTTNLARGVDRIVELTRHCRSVGASRLVVPLVDDGRLRGADDFPLLREILEEALRRSDAQDFEYHLETDLAPHDVASLIACLPDERIMINYDTGNSASLGYDAAQEFAAYGDRIGSIHIKDRVRAGSSVPLGQGAADFGATARAMRNVGYRGPLVLQVARGPAGGEVAWIRSQVAFVRRHLLPSTP